MIEDRHLELIHAELDGELSGEGRAELARVLLANPEARARRDELSRLLRTLDAVESEAPPADLTASVLAAIDLRGSTSRVRATPGIFGGRVALRYAAAFVGGVLASAAVFQLGKSGSFAPDVSELVGTIGGNAAVRQIPADRIQLELDQVSGRIHSWELGPQLVLELDLQAREPVEVVATYGGQTVRLSVDPQAGAASQHVLWLPALDRAPGSEIDLRLVGAGRVLYEGTLEARAN